MRLLLVCVVVLATVRSGYAVDRVTEMYEHQIDLVEHDILSLAEAMPGDKYDFRPTNGTFDDVRTFGEQIKHVATMIYMTAAIVLQEQSPYGPGTNNNGPDSVQGKQQILDCLRGALAYARKATTSLTEKNHLDMLKTYFGMGRAPQSPQAWLTTAMIITGRWSCMHA